MAEILSGRKVVANAGTAETLVAGSTKVSYVIIQAETNNTGTITVGDANVDDTTASRTGIALNAGDTISTIIDDLLSIYLDCETGGDGVTYLAKMGR